MSTFFSLGTGSEGLKQRLVNRQWMPQMFSSGIFCLLFFQRNTWRSVLHKCLHTSNLSENFSFLSLSISIPMLLEIFLSCLCFVQLRESRAQSFVASFDEMCTCPYQAVLRISVLFCFVVSLSSVSQQLRNLTCLSAFCSDDLLFSLSKEKMQEKTFSWVW